MKALCSFLFIGLCFIVLASLQWGSTGTFWAALAVAILLVAFGVVLVVAGRVRQSTMSGLSPN